MNDTENNYRLYVRDFCGFCYRVQHVIEQLGLEVETRNIWDNKAYELELVEATGRGTVPVLAIESADDTRWMSESEDIIRYLQTKHG